MDDNVFEQLAATYDSPERKETAGYIVQEVRKELEDSSTKFLVDYGGGTGLVGLALADLVKSVQLIDSSEQMLKIAEEKIKRSGITNASVLCADYTKETPEPQADIVLVSLVLLHIPDTKDILQKLFHLLNRGGKLLIVDFDKNEQINHPKVHNGFYHEDLQNLLKEAGFVSSHVHTFHHGEKIFMKQDASMFLAAAFKED